MPATLHVCRDFCDSVCKPENLCAIFPSLEDNSGPLINCRSPCRIQASLISQNSSDNNSLNGLSCGSPLIRRVHSPYAAKVVPREVALQSWIDSHDSSSFCALSWCQDHQMDTGVTNFAPLIAHQTFFTPQQPQPQLTPAAAASQSALPTQSLKPLLHTEKTENNQVIIRRIGGPKNAAMLRKKSPIDCASCAWNDSITSSFVYEIHHKSRTTFAVGQLLFVCGDLVVLDGDKGHDIGEVAQRFEIRPETRTRLPSLKVYRIANAAEVEHYSVQLEASEQGLRTYLNTLSEASRLGAQVTDSRHTTYWSDIGKMNFVDVEVQADHGKIYVFFRANEPIRFLALAQSLFSIFGCRIWLHQLDRGTPSSSANTSLEVPTK